MKYLSEIELYYSAPENVGESGIIINDEDYRHIVKVMRHSAGDEIYATNGRGTIFRTNIKNIDKDSVELIIIEKYEYVNKLKNVSFCIPKLKNPDRFEFALEKSVELGITNFIIYDAVRSISKGEKIERWNKIILAAMKQSLLSFLPEIKPAALDEIANYSGKKIILEQNSAKYINFLTIDKNTSYYFIFGPEGGFEKKELSMFNEDYFYKLADNRLRSETAIIKCASFLGELFLSQ